MRQTRWGCSNPLPLFAALAWPALAAAQPQGAADRALLLHYGADALLIALGVVLAVRLMRTLDAIEALHRTLELRVAQSERRLAGNYERLLRLERRHAALHERQEIMRDLHDGLGSRLFVILTRAESDGTGRAEIVDGLRECIADMRVTLDAMSAEGDFLQAWSAFRFRWQQAFEAAALASRWDVDTGGESPAWPPRVTVQLLRIVQEALTNTIKHAGATNVSVRLRIDARRVEIEVSDDGRGLAAAAQPDSHGMTNMRVRAARLGAQLQITGDAPGVRVLLSLERGAIAVA